MLNFSGCRPARCSIYFRRPSALQSRQAELARSEAGSTNTLAVLDSPQSVTQSRSQADRFHTGGEKNRQRMFIRFCGLLWYFSGEVKVMLACTCILSASGMLSYLKKWWICHDKKLLLMILLEEGVHESNSEAAVTLNLLLSQIKSNLGCLCLD